MIPATSPSLYDVLGIQPDADAAAIKAGYRRACKAHHPDKGGSRDAFAHVQLAYDILSNPDRRARYDATGDQTESKPDNEQSEIIGMMMGAINDVIGRPIPPGGCVITMATQQLRAQAEGGQEANDGLIKKRGGLERILSRLTHKGDGPDYIAIAIRDQIDGLTRNIAGNDVLIKRMGLAANMLRDGWTFERETMADAAGMGGSVIRNTPGTASGGSWTFL